MTKQEIYQNLDFDTDRKVDPDNLDFECEQQTLLYSDYSDLFNEKLDEVKEQKRNMKIQDIELERLNNKLYIKYSLEKIDGKKPTNDFIKSKIQTDEKYILKQDENLQELKKLNQLEYELSVLETAKDTMRQKKNMIEQRITLYLSGYNSEVKQKDYKNRVQNKLNRDKK